MDDTTRTRRRAAPGRRSRGNRLWWLAALFLAFVVSNIGCDPISTVGWIANTWSPNTTDPTCPLTLPDKESKVVFICAHEDEIASELTFRDADQIICRQLVTMLGQRYKENKDKVKIVPVSQVYAYIHEHRNWITMSKAEIGKHFGADFLVYLELSPMTLYETGSNNTLYRGNVEVAIHVFDVNQPEGEAPKYDPICKCIYPLTHPEDASAMSATNFRNKFLERVAKDLTPYFAATPPKDKMEED